MNHIRGNTTVSSSTFLVLSNLLIIIMALLFHWSILTLLWGYWLQSLIIGFFTILKLLMFGNRNTRQGGFLTSIRTLIFFTTHYGIFHVVYLLFLYFFTTNGNAGAYFKPADYGGVAFIGFLFFINHLYSFVKHYIWEKETIIISPNQIFLEPYKRIFPMHLTIIAAGFFSALIPPAQTPLLFMFLILKTLADLKSHEILHQSETHPSFRLHT
jgi:Family of unknown function (DUF6498)